MTTIASANAPASPSNANADGGLQPPAPKPLSERSQHVGNGATDAPKAADPTPAANEVCDPPWRECYSQIVLIISSLSLLDMLPQEATSMREMIKGYMRLAQEMRDNYLDGYGVSEYTKWSFNCDAANAADNRVPLLVLYKAGVLACVS